MASFLIQLQNVPRLATNVDIRTFFKDVNIPNGGVQLYGGEFGDGFVKFDNEADLFRALTMDKQLLLGQPLRIYPASSRDIDKVVARQRQLWSLCHSCQKPQKAESTQSYITSPNEGLRNESYAKASPVQHLPSQGDHYQDTTKGYATKGYADPSTPLYIATSHDLPTKRSAESSPIPAKIFAGSKDDLVSSKQIVTNAARATYINPFTKGPGLVHVEHVRHHREHSTMEPHAENLQLGGIQDASINKPLGKGILKATSTRILQDDLEQARTIDAPAKTALTSTDILSMLQRIELPAFDTAAAGIRDTLVTALSKGRHEAEDTDLRQISKFITEPSTFQHVLQEPFVQKDVKNSKSSLIPMSSVDTDLRALPCGADMDLMKSMGKVQALSAFQSNPQDISVQKVVKSIKSSSMPVTSVELSSADLDLREREKKPQASNRLAKLSANASKMHRDAVHGPHDVVMKEDQDRCKDVEQGTYYDPEDRCKQMEQETYYDPDLRREFASWLLKMSAITGGSAEDKERDLNFKDVHASVEIEGNRGGKDRNPYYSKNKHTQLAKGETSEPIGRPHIRGSDTVQEMATVMNRFQVGQKSTLLVPDDFDLRCSGTLKPQVADRLPDESSLDNPGFQSSITQDIDLRAIKNASGRQLSIHDFKKILDNAPNVPGIEHMLLGGTDLAFSYDDLRTAARSSADTKTQNLKNRSQPMGRSIRNKNPTEMRRTTMKDSGNGPKESARKRMRSTSSNETYQKICAGEENIKQRKMSPSPTSPLYHSCISHSRLKDNHMLQFSQPICDLRAMRNADTTNTETVMFNQPPKRPGLRELRLGVLDDMTPQKESIKSACRESSGNRTGKSEMDPVLLSSNNECYRTRHGMDQGRDEGQKCKARSTKRPDCGTTGAKRLPASERISDKADCQKRSGEFKLVVPMDRNEKRGLCRKSLDRHDKNRLGREIGHDENKNKVGQVSLDQGGRMSKARREGERREEKSEERGTLRERACSKDKGADGKKALQKESKKQNTTEQNKRLEVNLTSNAKDKNKLGKVRNSNGGDRRHQPVKKTSCKEQKYSKDKVGDGTKTGEVNEKANTADPKRKVEESLDGNEKSTVSTNRLEGGENQNNDKNKLSLDPVMREKNNDDVESDHQEAKRSQEIDRPRKAQENGSKHAGIVRAGNIQRGRAGITQRPESDVREDAHNGVSRQVAGVNKTASKEKPKTSKCDTGNKEMIHDVENKLYRVGEKSLMTVHSCKGKPSNASTPIDKTKQQNSSEVVDKDTEMGNCAEDTDRRNNAMNKSGQVVAVHEHSIKGTSENRGKQCKIETSKVIADTNGNEHDGMDKPAVTASKPSLFLEFVWKMGERMNPKKKGIRPKSQ